MLTGRQLGDQPPLVRAETHQRHADQSPLGAWGHLPFARESRAIGCSRCAGFDWNQAQFKPSTEAMT